MSRRLPSRRSPKPPSSGEDQSSGADFPFISERLNAAHDFSGFSSGRPELDDWLRVAALNADAAGTGRTHVWVDDAGTVVAYHVLAPHVARREDVPRKTGRGSPDVIPAILLARLALAEELHGQGFGAALLFDALERAVLGIEIVGGRLIVVDAIDERAATFYERYGFARTAKDPGRLVIKASDVRKSLW